MLLLEEFKRCLPDCIVVYLNEQKVSYLSCAAVLADEYMLTHETTFGPQSVSVSERKSFNPVQSSNTSQKENRECYYCHKPGNVIANCRMLKNKEAKVNQPPTPPKGIGLIKGEEHSPQIVRPNDTLDECLSPSLLMVLCPWVVILLTSVRCVSCETQLVHSL